MIKAGTGAATVVLAVVILLAGEGARADAVAAPQPTPGCVFSSGGWICSGQRDPGQPSRTTPTPESAAPTPGENADPDETDPATVPVTPDPTDSAAPAPEQTDAEAERQGVLPLAAVGLGGAAVVLAAISLVLWRRARSQSRSE